MTMEKLKNVPSKYQKKEVRMTLDYIEDFNFFETIIKHFKENKVDLEFETILEYLSQNPDVVKINWHKEQSWKDNQTNMIKRLKGEGA